jgi:hypothetical protein
MTLDITPLNAKCGYDGVSFMLSVTFFILSVFMPSVVALNVVAPRVVT